MLFEWTLLLHLSWHGLWYNSASLLSFVTKTKRTFLGCRQTFYLNCAIQALAWMQSSFIARLFINDSFSKRVTTFGHLCTYISTVPESDDFFLRLAQRLQTRRLFKVSFRAFRGPNLQDTEVVGAAPIVHKPGDVCCTSAQACSKMKNKKEFLELFPSKFLESLECKGEDLLLKTPVLTLFILYDKPVPIFKTHLYENQHKKLPEYFFPKVKPLGVWNSANNCSWCCRSES